MRRGRYYALVILALIAVLNTADQAVLLVNLPAIQLDLRLTDTQVGLLSSAFVAVYALAVLPAGYLGDRTARRMVVGVGVGLWSLATLLTGLARTFPQMVLARAALGIGESTALPSTMSLLGDHFAREARGRAAGAIGAALQVGTGVGAVAGGLVAGRLGWHAAFYLAAIPGLVLAFLAFTIREAPRGAAEPSRRTVPGSRQAGGRVFLQVLRIPTFVLAAGANGFLYLAVTGVAGFAGLYLSRRFGVGAAGLGLMLGPPLLISGLLGNSAGGWLIDRRGKVTRSAPLEVAAAGCAIGAGGMFAMFSVPSSLGFEIAFTIAATAAQMAVPGLLAINQNVVSPDLRGSATALQQLMTNLFGRTAGLLLVGTLADALHDLRLAFVVVAPVGLMAAAVLGAVGLQTICKDSQAMEAGWGRSGQDALSKFDAAVVRVD